MEKSDSYWYLKVSFQIRSKSVTVIWETNFIQRGKKDIT